MASSEIDVHGAGVKIRDVGWVVVLTVLTLGIYNLYWYYKINEELRDYGRVYQDEELSKISPGVALLAVTLGVILIVPPILSYIRTTARIRQAQRIGQTELTNGWVIFACVVGYVIFVLPGLAIPGYVQSGLNRLWERYRWAEAAPLPQATEVPEASRAA